ncbi:MAG: MtnX-like HAD-IB family phosphatase [bacterium]
MKIFCDFDGTISPRDVGNELFSRFTNGKAKEIVEKWKAGEIDSRAMYLRSIQHLQITKAELEKFLLDQSIDPHFSRFVRFCEKRSFSTFILSDGMDLYIRPILDRNELEHVAVYSNKLTWKDEKTLIAEFPYYDQTCGRCANCKGYHLRRFSENGAESVLVGDGLSDICAAKEADLIFAKNDLEAYCRKENIPFMPFRDFSDIMDGLEVHLMNNS